MNKKTRAKLETAIRKSRLNELLDWYERFRPTQRVATISAPLADMLEESKTTAEHMGFAPVTAGRILRAFSYRGFVLKPETQTWRC
jgi:hypothetical protein